MPGHDIPEAVMESGSSAIAPGREARYQSPGALASIIHCPCYMEKLYLCRHKKLRKTRCKKQFLSENQNRNRQGGCRSVSSLTKELTLILRNISYTHPNRELLFGDINLTVNHHEK